MGLVSKILSRLNILVIQYHDAETYSCHLRKARLAGGDIEVDPSRLIKNLDEIRAELKGCPLDVWITGYGVISKSVDVASDIVIKVKSSDQEFVWSEDDGCVSFIRKKQVQCVLDELRGSKAKIVAVTCMVTAVDESLVKSRAETCFRDLGLKILFKPSARGCALAMCLINKVKFFVLGLLLVVAAANAVLKPSARMEYETAKRELDLLRGRNGEASVMSRKKADALMDFNCRLPVSASLICDRIAMALPTDMVLTGLAICPLVKKIENDKQTEFKDNSMHITGLARESSDVSNYVTALKKLSISDDISLSGLEYDKDYKLYAFTISINL